MIQLSIPPILNDFSLMLRSGQPLPRTAQPIACPKHAGEGLHCATLNLIDIAELLQRAGAHNCSSLTMPTSHFRAGCDLVLNSSCLSAGSFSSTLPSHGYVPVPHAAVNCCSFCSAIRAPHPLHDGLTEMYVPLEMFPLRSVSSAPNAGRMQPEWCASHTQRQYRLKTCTPKWFETPPGHCDDPA